jgi:cell division GTPase FtsZ
MKVLIIGLGQAGGKIADEFTLDDKKSEFSGTIKCITANTAKSDLMGLRYISMEDRILIGETVVKGHGVGADNKKGAKIMEDEIDVILNRVSNLDVSNRDAFFVIAGLGGGTGSGAISIVCNSLKQIYDEPVYSIGILPAENEGDIYTLNAARSLKSLLPKCDATILVDNGAFLHSGESVGQAYDRINSDIAKRLGILFRSGEISSRSQVAEMVVDASEIINTLKVGGICSIGYSSEAVPKKRIFSKFFGKDQYEIGKAARIFSVVKRAVKGRLLLPCDSNSASKALIIIAGPPDQLDRKGIEKSRQWLEDTIAGTEVRGGDYPLPTSNFVGCVVLLSGISSSPRVVSMLQRAKYVQERKAEEPTREKDLDYFLGEIENLKK